MPGMYTVSGARSGGYSAPNQTVEVVAGRTSTVTLAYAPIVGSLTVAVHGLPATLAASVTVTGQGFSQTVPVAGTGTHVLPDLTPGTYTVSAGGAVGYSAPSELAAVASGQSPTVTLVFMPIAQSPRWSLWQIVAMLGLALMLLIAALSMRRRRAVETASVIQIRSHRDPGTQRIYVDGRPLEPGSHTAHGAGCAPKNPRRVRVPRHWAAARPVRPDGNDRSCLTIRRRSTGSLMVRR